MTRKRKDELLTVLAAITEDAEADAASLDGKELNAATIGAAFGNALAMIHALSKALRVVVNELEDSDA